VSSQPTTEVIRLLQSPLSNEEFGQFLGGQDQCLIGWLPERMTPVNERARFDNFRFGDGNEPIVGATAKISTERDTWRFLTGRQADRRKFQALNKGRDRVFGQRFVGKVLPKSGRDHRKKQNVVDT
jgi:hypothetical protein